MWYIAKHTIFFLKAVAEMVSIVPVACWALHLALQVKIQKTLKGGNKKKKKWFMTVEYNLEQNHCSFQEDVAIDGNIFFKG